MNSKILLLVLLSNILISNASTIIGSYPNFQNNSKIVVINPQLNLNYNLNVQRINNTYKNFYLKILALPGLTTSAYTETVLINIYLNASNINYTTLQTLAINNLYFRVNSSTGIKGQISIIKIGKTSNTTLNTYNINPNIIAWTGNSSYIVSLNTSKEYIQIKATLIADATVRVDDKSFFEINFTSTKWTYNVATVTTTITTTIQNYYCNQTGFWFKCAQSRVLAYVNNWNFTMKVYYNFSYPCDYYHNCLTYPHIYNNTFTYTGAFLFIKIPYFDGMSSTFSDLYFRAFAYSNATKCGGIVDNGRCLVDLGEIPFAIYNYSKSQYAYIVLSNTTTLGSSYNYFYIFFNSPNSGFNNQSLLNKYFYAMNVKNYSISNLGNPYIQIVVLKSPLVGNGKIVSGWEVYEGIPTINNNQYGNRYLSGTTYTLVTNPIVSSEYLDTIFVFYYNNMWDGRYILSPHILTNSKVNWYFTVANAYENKTKSVQYNTGFFAGSPYALVRDANISFVSKPFSNNVFIFNQIESYLPYLNINYVNIPKLISAQSNQIVNSFLAFVIILVLAFLMKNEVIAMLLFALLFLFSLIFPNTFSFNLSTFALVLVLLYILWKFGKVSE